jgi:hypothetical protein
MVQQRPPSTHKNGPYEKARVVRASFLWDVQCYLADSGAILVEAEPFIAFKQLCFRGTWL